MGYRTKEDQLTKEIDALRVTNRIDRARLTNIALSHDDRLDIHQAIKDRDDKVRVILQRRDELRLSKRL